MLDINQLTKRYGQKTVLDDLTLHFSAGQVYGIVGENGAGKTTFFRCIAGLEHYDGDIRSPYPCLKAHLGYVTTTPEFMSYLTGWEYLKLMCIAKDIPTEDFDAQNILRLPLQQYAETYSTGMKKKLAIMGTLLRQNDIFIFDEPFNGVDIESNIMITQIILELKALGKTILLSSHIFSTLRSTCDYIIRLSNGKIVGKVEKANFDQLEDDMKQGILGSQWKNIRLT